MTEIKSAVALAEEPSLDPRNHIRQLTTPAPRDPTFFSGHLRHSTIHT